jgi:hypothetical protein
MTSLQMLTPLAQVHYRRHSPRGVRSSRVLGCEGCAVPPREREQRREIAATIGSRAFSYARALIVSQPAWRP